MKVCIVGASGKLGQYMVRHCLDRGYEVVGVCRAQSTGKLVRLALSMVEALTNDALIHEAPAIVGRQTESALARTPIPG